MKVELRKIKPGIARADFLDSLSPTDAATLIDLVERANRVFVPGLLNNGTMWGMEAREWRDDYEKLFGPVRPGLKELAERVETSRESDETQWTRTLSCACGERRVHQSDNHYVGDLAGVVYHNEGWRFIDGDVRCPRCVRREKK